VKFASDRERKDMPRIAYLDCPTGIAGDMCLGALVDAGVPLTYLQQQLERLGMSDEYELRAETVCYQGQQGTKVHVDLSSETTHEHPPHRHLPQIEQIIQQGQFPHRAQNWSLAVFRRLAAAEAAVHGVDVEKVHFHEVGATDAIVDIVGTCLGLDWLEIEDLYCSALPVGGGTVKASHGRLPVPVPAVLKLWEMRQVPTYSNGIEKELVTPTGAAIATTLATNFGFPPAMTLQKVGWGAGSRQLSLPNMLRLWLGETTASGETTETIAVLQTQIDDLFPQAIGYVLEMLFAAGALDVFTQGIGMKKSRPGILLTVICPPQLKTSCEKILFRETTTLGIRSFLQQRSVLQRQIQTATTPWGQVRVKVATDGHGEVLNVQPEYEDCAQIARSHNLPWYEVYRTVMQVWGKDGEEGKA
jgi:hypothetical protein